ncbi:hypothetical protein [Actinoplanes regularis]|uniref:hypothetical protein n=1 Tax=Actinoplanes regularis TaxID=52697 RepID=UPI000B78A78E|nr:hypothetical protein [Actinoplanes regularis]
MHDQIRRLVIGSVLLASAFAPAGCSLLEKAPVVAQPPATTSPTPDPAQAVARLGQESARFTVVFGEAEKVSGVIDQATGNWEMTGDGYVVRRVGADVYVKLTGEPPHSVFPGQYGDDLGKWVHLAAPSDAPAFDRDFPWAPARKAAAAEFDVAGRFSRVTLRDPAMVVSYSHYGTVVQVAAPPADQTIEDHLFTPGSLGSIF